MRLSSIIGVRALFCGVASFAAISSALLTQAASPPRAWPANPFTPLTPERIAALPSSERGAWHAYWEASEKLAVSLPNRPQADRSLIRPNAGPPVGGTHTKGLRFGEPEAWYAGTEARAIADRIAVAQTPAGAWAKGMVYSAPIEEVRRSAVGATGTFDNDATIFELRFLALVISAVGPTAAAPEWHPAFERGLKYVFAAQYPNGGYPQLYPLAGGYHDGVTFNDDAMIHILELLKNVAGRKQGTAFVSSELRDEAQRRLQLGLRCVLATQLRNAKGELTVWCQQYDPLTLKPSAARNFEPIADVSRESASITQFLMSFERPSPEIIAAVEGAAAWFKQTALQNLRIAGAPADARGKAVPSPGAPPIWARFYEPGTSTPIFGDRDRTIHYDLGEVSAERIAGYAWYTQAPAKTLAMYERWKKSAGAQ